MKTILKAIFFVLFSTATLSAHESFREAELEAIHASLDSLAAYNPAYSELVDISVTDFPVSELIRNLAIANGLNIDISFTQTKRITCNMKSVPVKDALFFFCKEKSLDATFTENIITLADYVPPSAGPAGP